MPGPRSITRSSHLARRARAGQLHPGAGRRVAHCVLHQVGDDPFEQAGVGDDLGQVSGTSTSTGAPAAPRDRARVTTTSSRPTGADSTGSTPACSRDRSSRLVTRSVSRSSAASAVPSSSWRSCFGPVDVSREQAGHRRFRRRDRGAQIVADRIEQRGPRAFGLGQRLHRLRRFGELALPVGDGGLDGERDQDALVLAAPARARHRTSVADRRSGLAVRAIRA